MSILELIRQTGTYKCLDCQLCNNVCPITPYRSSFSPHQIIQRIYPSFAGENFDNPEIWCCLTCGACVRYCPYNVDFVGFIRELRILAFNSGYRGIYAHNGLLQSIMQLCADRLLTPNKIEYLNIDKESISDNSEYLLYIGCAPYFETIFEDFAGGVLRNTQGALKILNKLGIKPKILDEERCCGHDLLLNGNYNTFKRLVKRNWEMLKNSGIKTILFTCPECLSTFRDDYSKIVDINEFHLMHILELVDEQLQKQQLTLSSIKERITYLDPCYFLDHSVMVRSIINAIPDVEYQELVKDIKDSYCCGTHSWMNCFNHSKQIQLQRLKQIKQLNVSTLLTSCSKCRIHLLCAQNKEKNQFNIIDILDWLSQAF